MVDYYPVQCTKCRRFLGYTDIDLEDSDNYQTAVWCKYCMELKPKEEKA